MDFPNRLSRSMAEKKISGAGLARLVGVTRKNISDWKMGKSEPGLEMIENLAQKLDVHPSYLAGWTHQKALGFGKNLIQPQESPTEADVMAAIFMCPDQVEAVKACLWVLKRPRRSGADQTEGDYPKRDIRNCPEKAG